MGYALHSVRSRSFMVTKDEPQYKINRTKKLKLHCRKQYKKGKKKEIHNSL